MANTNQLITYKLNWLAAVNSTKNSVNSVISFQSNDHARSRMFAGEVRPTKSCNSNDPAKAVTKKSRFNKVNKPDLVGFVQGISTGATFLVIVVVLIIVIIIALKKQRERSEPCYVDNNLFTIRHIPSYNISPHIGSWDRNNTLGSITDDNIYYNDTEMFQPSSDAEDYKDDANIYHVIESRADCEHDLVSSCSSDTEYDLNDNTRSTEGDLDDIKNCSTTASMSKEDSKISESETNDAEIRSTTLSKLDDKQNNLST
ncbi:hypothetical protein EB796_014364 [Bugula neritina]|uniref:Uncharacterized protein n=1 Tax=Bugula neritina TaxID=10212 RepID=A0A7J7JNY5_BUGNE|nr:hypothetical protein EB796_014364 [Bugula neritina]